MSRIITALVLLLIVSLPALAQAAKGVDKQNERVRDSGSERTPANNGNKTDVGAGRGFDFGRGRTRETPPLPNPYRLSGRRDVMIKAVQDVMRDHQLVVDDAASKFSDGIIVSQPYTFTKGAVVSEAELSRYADVPSSAARGWTRGRYTLTVEIQPIDGSTANVAVNAKVEGRTDGPTGAEWRSLTIGDDTYASAARLRHSSVACSFSGCRVTTLHGRRHSPAHTASACDTLLCWRSR